TERIGCARQERASVRGASALLPRHRASRLDGTGPPSHKSRVMTIHEADVKPAGASPGAPDPTEAGGLLTIDLAAIAANWQMLATATVPGECPAVLKGDG